jgi:anti-sigma regulatory factor (Ser/Thr protein kinase)
LCPPNSWWSTLGVCNRERMGKPTTWSTPARVRRTHDEGMLVGGYLRWPLVRLLELGPNPAAPACARLYTKTVLAAWGLPRDTIVDAETCVSETITNALRATLALGELLPIGLRLLANTERLVTEAWDCHPGVPVVRPVTLDDEGGRGLAVIEAYSNRWGVRRLSPRVKAVWCELLVPPIRPGGTGW